MTEKAEPGSDEQLGRDGRAQVDERLETEQQDMREEEELTAAQPDDGPG